jgi:rhamnogalacturonan endolyase
MNWKESLNKGLKKTFYLLIVLCFQTGPGSSQRWMENLDRGTVAVKLGGDSVYIGWRMLGTDPIDIGFNLYRLSGNKVVMLNTKPLIESTNYVDIFKNSNKPLCYFVRPVINSKELEATDTAEAWATNYLSIPLQSPVGHFPNDVSMGDLDGDGDYELVVHQAGRSADNARAGMTSEPILEAYDLS